MSRPAPIALGIDVGGTKTLFAIVDVTSGGVAEQRRIETPRGAESGESFLQRVESEAREFVNSSSAGSVSAIGLGICELVDRDGGVKSAHRVHWQGLPVREALSAHCSGDRRIGCPRRCAGGGAFWRWAATIAIFSM